MFKRIEKGVLTNVFWGRKFVSDFSFRMNLLKYSVQGKGLTGSVQKAYWTLQRHASDNSGQRFKKKSNQKIVISNLDGNDGTI